MGKVLLEEQSLIDIANSIRNKTKSTETMKPSEMAGNIDNISANLGTKNITENGVYNATDDNLDGYSQVNVEISGGGSADLSEYFLEKPTKYINYSNAGAWIATIKKIPVYEISDEESLKYLYAHFKGEEIDVSKINTYGVTDMSYMFYQCEYVKKLNLSHFDTLNVTNMASMFSHVKGVTSIGSGEEYDINIENFETDNVFDMGSMFAYCSGLRTLNIKHFNTPNLTDMTSMFAYCIALTSIDLSNFDTSNVTNMGSMFNNCPKLTDINLNFDASKVTRIGSAFDNSNYIENLVFMNNLGKGYTQKTNNYTYYRLKLPGSSLTVESLIDVLNKLYDLNLTYDVANGGTLYTQQVIIGSNGITKLEATEEGQQAIENATLKGWTVK